MKLLVFVLCKLELENKLLNSLATSGIRGATILDSTGMAQQLAQSEYMNSIDALTEIFNPGREKNKTILMVLKDEEISLARRVINEIVGDLSIPNTGILFTLPMDFVDGFYR